MHTYHIKFDYKILTDTGTDGLFYVTVQDKKNIVSGLGKYGTSVLDGVFKGDTGTFECDIQITNNLDSLCTVIGGRFAGDIAIDNLSITETEKK
jgi:hypothetical protein